MDYVTKMTHISRFSLLIIHHFAIFATNDFTQSEI